MSDSPDQIFDGCVGGIGFALFALLGMLILAISWRHEITVSPEWIERRDLLHCRRLQTADLVRLEWRCPPRSGRIVLSDGAHRLSINLYDYSPADRKTFIDRIRDVAPDDVEQVGWDDTFFGRTPRVRSRHELKRILRFTVIASFFGWLALIAIYAWHKTMDPGMPPLWVMTLKGIPMFGFLPFFMAILGWIERLDVRENRRGT